MERALRNFAIAFFFAFPAVFLSPALLGGMPVLTLIGLVDAVSVFEGARLAFLVIGSFAMAYLALASKWRNLGFSQLRGRFFPTFAFAVPFWISAYANPGFPVSDVLAGETYSVLPFMAIFLVAVSVSVLSPQDRRNAVTAFVLGFVSVNFPLSVIQISGLDPFSSSFSFPWDGDRAYGTLGNPNSLAFLSVLCLPVAFALFSKGTIRKFLVSALFVICLATSSWSGTAVFLAYLAYRYFGFAKSSAATLAITVSFFVFSYEFHDKRMSVGTRFAIVGDSALRSVSNPRTFFVGDGAWAVADWFSRHRSAEVTNFVHPLTPIDRTHFFFLDVALVFWTPFALVLFFAAWKRSRKTERPVREALSAFLVLSCLHTPDSAHLVLVAVLLVNGLPVLKKPVPSAWTA